MRRNVGTEKDTAYGGGRRTPGDLASILPPAIPLPADYQSSKNPATEDRHHLFPICYRWCRGVQILTS
jgi:hypothetical protein